MPYFDTYNSQFGGKKPEEEQGLSNGLNDYFKGAGSAPIFGSSGGVGGGSAVRGPLSPAQGGATASTGDESSGSDFVNYGQYVNANADVAQRNANEITGRVDKTAQGAAAGMGDLYNQFSGAVKAGTGKGPATSTNIVPGSGSQSTQIVNYGPGSVGSTNSGRSAVANTGASPATRNPGTQLPGQMSSASADGRSVPGDRTVAAGTARGLPSASENRYIDPTRSRDALVAGAAQTYTGPEGLSDQSGYDEATGQVTNAQGQLNALQSKDGLSGYLSQQFGGQAGSGGNELDSLLIGRAGGQQFKDVAQKNAGLGGLAAEYGKQGEGLVKQAKADTDLVSGKYKSLLGEFDAAENDRTTKNAASDAAIKAKEKKYSYKDYTTRPENYVASNASNILETLDPVAWALKAAGMPTLESKVHHKFDQWGNDMLDTDVNSQAVDFRRELPSYVTDSEIEALYNDLTQDELAEVEKMSVTDRKNFLLNRRANMGGAK